MSQLRPGVAKLICCCSVAQLCPALCGPMDHSTPGFSGLQYLPEFAQTHVHRVSDATQTPHSLLLPSPLALNLSLQQGLFQWASSLHQVAKVWGASASISPSNEYSGLISLRIDGFDLLSVQGTLKSLLQHHNLKAAILQCSHSLGWGLLNPHVPRISVFDPKRQLILFKWGERQLIKCLKSGGPDRFDTWISYEYALFYVAAYGGRDGQTILSVAWGRGGEI